MTRSGQASLLVICGATATGKTRLGVDVAHALGSQIISADSRQVYRGLDVGTGKDLAEYRRVSPPVVYHLIDVVDPATVYTLQDYQRDCYRLVGRKRQVEPFSGGTPLVVVGGTALYLAAVLLGYRIPRVPEDPGLRRRLEQRELPELIEELRLNHPELLERTDTSTKRRVIRALEVAIHARQGGLTYGDPPPQGLRSMVFATRVERREIHSRIDRRLEERLEEGLIEEVQGLLDGGLSPRRLDQLGLEYRFVARHLAGEIGRDEMVYRLKVAIHRFARRQEIWFRSFPRRGIPVTWIDPNDSATVLARWSCDGESGA